MTAQMTATDYPRLPGPSRLVANVVADIKVGKTVVIVFPEAAVDAGIADAILDDISNRHGRAEFCVTSDEPFPNRVLDTFGADPVGARDFDDWESIIRWEPWHQSWLVLPGWENPDVAEVVARWPAQLHASGLSADDRPKLIIGVRLSDMERAALTRLGGDIGVHWWWGALTRLDTETRLAAVADRSLNTLDAAVITELAGWDLRAVDHLAERWDRTTVGLPAAVAEYQRQHLMAPVPPPPRTARATIPPPELERDWRDGFVDRWSHSIRRTPAGLDDKGITQLLWFAHNRVLMPHIDEERDHFERLILAKTSAQQLADLRRRDDDLIEIGSLAWLADSGRVSLDRDDRDRLRTFRNLRNDLAHRIPINDDLRVRVVRYLDLDA
ncbi:hypothetical protein ACWDTI_02765 [Gordonia sp. NPDC003424]